MSRLLPALAVAAILLLVAAFVPMGERTLVERWNAAPSPSSFAQKGWDEVVGAWDGLWGVKRPAKGSPRVASKGATGTARPAQQPPPAARPEPEPVEHHTDADRKALDRIVAEHAKDGRASRP